MMYFKHIFFIGVLSQIFFGSMISMQLNQHKISSPISGAEFMQLGQEFNIPELIKFGQELNYAVAKSVVLYCATFNQGLNQNDRQVIVTIFDWYKKIILTEKHHKLNAVSDAEDELLVVIFSATQEILKKGKAIGLTDDRLTKLMFFADRMYTTLLHARIENTVMLAIFDECIKFIQARLQA